MTLVKILINNFNEKIQNAEKSDNFNAQRTSFENSEQWIKRDFSYVIINDNMLFNIYNANDDARERQQFLFSFIINVFISFIKDKMIKRMIVV